MKKCVFLVLSVAFILFLSHCSPKESKEHPSLTQSEMTAATLRGQEISRQSFIALSGALQTALKTSGVAGAIGYCQISAIPLIDSLSQTYAANIRRASTKIRNPQDTATRQELSVLERYRLNLEENERLDPIVELSDGSKVAFYAPIIVQAPCLKCHGMPGKDIIPQDYAVITGYYPDDEATGYQLGDLRGIWSITFNRQDLIPDK